MFPTLNSFACSRLDERDHCLSAAALVLLTTGPRGLEVLMAERVCEPSQGLYGLPEALVRSDQTLEEIVQVMAWDLDIDGVRLEQFHTFSGPWRDPRGRIVCTGYVGVVERGELERIAGANDATLLEVKLRGRGQRVELGYDGIGLHAAFDYGEVIGRAVEYLARMLADPLWIFELLPERFTLLQLQQIHEMILGRSLHKQVFRKTMLKRVFADGKCLVPTGTYGGGRHRPAQLYERTHPG